MANKQCIIANFHYPASKHIVISLPEIAEPRRLIKETLNQLAHTHPEAIILIAIRTIGRRIISQQDPCTIVNLINGKRQRIYYGMLINNKIHIKFMWYKIKHLNTQEKRFIENNWISEFFETTAKINGKHLIKQMGGSGIENLIYSHYPSIIASGDHLKKFQLDKLVRDKIPSNLEQKGVKVNLVKDADLMHYFKKKIVEEAEEVATATNREKTIEEIADVLDVIDAFMQQNNINKDEIQKTREEKTKEKGRFDKKLVIHSIEMEDDNPVANYYLTKPEKYPQLIL